MLRDNKLPLITLPSAYVSRLLTDTNILKLTLLTITQLLDIYIHKIYIRKKTTIYHVPTQCKQKETTYQLFTVNDIII